MTERFPRTRRIVVLLAALAAVGGVAAYSAMFAAADGNGRSTLDGNFCTSSHFCMTITFDGATVGTPTRTDPTQPDLTLRPGTYWLTVTDNSNGHNFALRSCPSANQGDDQGEDQGDGQGNGNGGHPAPPPIALCDQNSNGVVQQLTPLANPTTQPVVVTTNLHLKHGTYRLFCQAPNHEGLGMYVDIAVGGEGQDD